MPENSSLIVIRVGGSLLDLPQLHSGLQQLCDLLWPAPLLLITGGGHAADVIRELDGRCGLAPGKAHWDAIAAMTFNAQVLVRTGNHLQLAADREAAQQIQNSCRIPVLDTLTHLRTIGMATAARLPESWDVTSDSIAAEILRDWQGAKLILVKSCEPPASDIPGLAAIGAVDRYFPIASRGLDVDWCCLGIAGSEPILSCCRHM
ncbi:MAG: Uridylate kinase [Planctomycetota bacterium]|jgi:aspartokinase-like uncharacterized kinase